MKLTRDVDDCIIRDTSRELEKKDQSETSGIVRQSGY